MMTLLSVILLQIVLIPSLEAFPSLQVGNGTSAVPYSHPYIAYLTLRTEGFTGVWHCVGTLVSANYILTSAQCLDEASYINITLGLQTVSNASNEGTLLMATLNDVATPPRYNTKANLYGNIALVKLSQTLNFNTTGDKIKVAKLANELYIEDSFVDENGTISGWGFTDPYKMSNSDVLVEGTVKVISNDDCMTNQGFYVDNTIICTKPFPGSPCTFDEGGPLLVDGMVVGVIFSTDVNCTNPESSTMYTRVPNFIDWIRKNSDVQ